MRVFVKAVITGFGLSVGKMLYEKLSERIGEKSAAGKSDDPDPIVPEEDSDDPVAEPV